jgi:predicted amidohydrolase YtcJ
MAEGLKGIRIPENPPVSLEKLLFKLIEDVIPEHSLAEQKNALLAYQEMAAAVGITLVHDPMLDLESITAYNELAAVGEGFDSKNPSH